MLLFLSNGVDGWGCPSFILNRVDWWCYPSFRTGLVDNVTLPFKWDIQEIYPSFRTGRHVRLPSFQMGNFFMYVEILPWRIDFTITLKWGWRVRLPCLSTRPFKQTWQVKLPFLLNGLNGCRYSSYKIGWTWNLTLAFERGRWARLPFLLNKVDK